MGTEFKDVDVNMEDSGNSCGSSVVSDYSGPSDHTDFDGDGVQVSDLEGDSDELQLPQVRRLTGSQIFSHTFTSDSFLRDKPAFFKRTGLYQIGYPTTYTSYDVTSDSCTSFA